jgi:hypothetical protein
VKIWKKDLSLVLIIFLNLLVILLLGEKEEKRKGEKDIERNSSNSTHFSPSPIVERENPGTELENLSLSW